MAREGIEHSHRLPEDRFKYIRYGREAYDKMDIITMFKAKSTEGLIKIATKITSKKESKAIVKKAFKSAHDGQLPQINKDMRKVLDFVKDEVMVRGLFFTKKLLIDHMGFDKIITIGWGDNGVSKGYEHPIGCECGTEGCLTDKPSSKQFNWSLSETDSVIVHKEIWGDRLKPLKGGEVLRDSTPDLKWEQANISELENNLESKNELIKRITSLE